MILVFDNYVIDVFLSYVYVCIKDIRVTKVSARSGLKSCWKLASIRLLKTDCICDAVATE